MASLAHHLRVAVQRAGLDGIRYLRVHGSTGRPGRLLTRHRIDTVLDVGANTGQYAFSIRAGGYRRAIVSYEPLSAAFAKLQASARRDDRWSAKNLALGAAPGTLEINIAGNSVSSSFLPMLPSHASAAPKSAYVGREVVDVSTVDDEMRTISAERPFLKIDSQGFEAQILDGARHSLSRFQGVQLELSLVLLYEGQDLFDDILHRLTSEGLELWSLERGFTDPHDERLLQVDGWFFRPDAG
jgi:FkbM family methyltransferase